MIAHLHGDYRHPVLTIESPTADQVALINYRGYGGRRTQTGVDFRTLKVLPMALLTELAVPQVLDHLGVGDPDLVYRPLVECDPHGPNRLLVWPRMWGYKSTQKALPRGPRWIPGEGHFVADALVPLPLQFAYTQEALDRISACSAQRSSQAAGASELGLATDKNSLTAVGIGVLDEIPPVPEWFGLDLMPYQEVGSAAVVAGHRLLADEPGLGKTRQALAAAARVGATKIVIVTPSSHLYGWSSNAREAGFEAFGPIVTIRSGIKQPEIPDTGVIVLPTSLLAKRTELLADLCRWRPDVVVVDEVHLARNSKTARSVALKKLAGSASNFCVGITGTPYGKSPVELSVILEVTGQMDAVFGGRDAFLKRFTTKSARSFGALLPSAKQLDDLSLAMSNHVWVCRSKADVLPELPTKFRRIEYVDVPLARYSEAHAELVSRIADALEEHRIELGAYPDELEAWAKTKVGMISPLRRAAGVAKVPAAVGWIDTFRTGTGRQLLVWAHHAEVLEELDRWLTGTGVKHEMYLASMSPKERAARVERFQAGETPVLVLSLAAGSVAITLTAASDALFVETDWVPDVMTQAEDRIHRYGQEHEGQVTFTTLVAPGTLDPHIHKGLLRKSKILDAILPGRDNQVTAMASAEARYADPPRRLIGYLAAQYLASKGVGEKPGELWEDE